jgi:hypothetical protein
MEHLLQFLVALEMQQIIQVVAVDLEALVWEDQVWL